MWKKIKDFICNKKEELVSVELNPNCYSMSDHFADCNFIKNSNDLKLKSTLMTDLKPRLSKTDLNHLPRPFTEEQVEKIVTFTKLVYEGEI